MSTIVLRSVKGSPLTNTEVDTNFSNLNTDKVEKTAAAITGGTINGTSVGATTASTGAFTTLSATGVATFSAGTAALPAITTTGDTNTGIWFPAADTIAFTEGGVESMRIDASGNLGIGTSSPAYKLDVDKGSNGFIARFKGGTQAAYIYGDGSAVYLSSDASVATAFGLNENSDYLNFTTGGSEKMRLDSSGNLGIGTSSVLTNSRFDVRDVNRTGNASNSVVLTTTAQAADIGGTLGLGGLYDGSNSTVFGVVRGGKENSTSGNYAGYLSFGTVANSASITERARIDSSGNLLVGTTTTTNNLRLNEKIAIVHAGAGTYTGMAITGYSGTTGGARPLFEMQRSRGTTDGSLTKVESGDVIGSLIFRGSDGSGFKDVAEISVAIDGATGTDDLPGRITFATSSDGSIAPTERMRLDSSGNLGIGTSSPTRKLDVRQAYTADTIVAQIGNTNNGNGATPVATIFDFTEANGTSVSRISSIYTQNTGKTDLAFGTYNSGLAEKMRLDFSGNLGLGVTPSLSTSNYRTLQIGGTAKFSIFGQRDAGACETFVGWNAYGGSNTTTVGSGFYYTNTGDSATMYSQNAQHAWFIAPSGTANNLITFTQAMTLDASGNLLVGITTNASAGKLTVQGGATDPFSGTGYRLASFHSTSAANADQPGIVLGFDTAGAGIVAARTNATGQPIAFWTYNGSAWGERARIDSSGNLLVGVTSGSYHILAKDIGGNFATEIRNSNANPYGLYLRYTGAVPNSSVNEFLYCGDTVGQKMSVRSNGGIANYSASNVNLSDRREKTNFAPAGSYLDKICAIPVQTFNYIDQNLEEDGGLTLGVVAQDVQAVAPELVMESNWAGKDEEPKMRLGIYQTDLQYALMKCIQEQQALITQLTARITALEGA